MAIKITKNSWLAITPLISSNGFTFWDTPNFPELVPQQGDLFVEVDSQYLGRLDLIAYDHYGDVDYWWVIALANGLDQIPTDMRLGMTLRLPDKKYIDSIISKGPQ